jgi:hypothetical protein
MDKEREFPFTELGWRSDIGYYRKTEGKEIEVQEFSDDGSHKWVSLSEIEKRAET